MKTSLKCNCGQRILRRDVMYQNRYEKHMGPRYVYIKYRCSRCKKLGEHFVKQDEWEEGLLQECGADFNETERSRFVGLGAITLDEMKDFHKALDSLNEIPNLLEKKDSD